ncbi:MAG: hypothetical protein IJX16_04795 [Clostridia bacterium]|nr:hypothetical protein [Clostridia bacterium]
MKPFNEFPIIDVEEFQHATGVSDFHSIQTIELGELIESGVFTWERVDWKKYAYSEEQYERFCKAFELRFWLREISITPVGAWLKRLHYKLCYELMPKYKPLYEQLEEYNPLQNGGGYKRERRIDSEYPETLLSQSQDYASDGYDFEETEIKLGNLVEDVTKYALEFKTIDGMILSELENNLFSCLYTSNVNGL